MKQSVHIALLAFLFVISLVGCYDDSALQSELQSHESRISSLEVLVDQLNSSCERIVKLVTGGAVIKDVRVISGGTRVILSDGSSFMVQDGIDGKSPQIGIRKDSDGIYYWLLNGQWLLNDNGEKMPVSKSGITPKFKIEDSYWYVSYDESKTWTRLGKATGADGQSPFRSVVVNGDKVVITLADGTQFDAPRYKEMGINLSFDGEVGVVDGENCEVRFTLSGDNVKDMIVKAMGQGGWTARVVRETDASGKIVITAPDIVTDDEILVFVSCGENTIMRSISVVKGVINVVDGEYHIGAEGGKIAVNMTSNIDYRINVSASAASWISVDVQTKAMVNETLNLTVKKNNQTKRTGIVTINTVSGKILKKFVITQETGLSADIEKNVTLSAPGTLLSAIGGESALSMVKYLKVSGSINGTDIKIIRQMPSLVSLNISEARIVEGGDAYTQNGTVEYKTSNDILGSYAFYGLDITELDLPNGITAIEDKAISECKQLRSISIPSSVITIGVEAFANDSLLKEVLFEEDSKLFAVKGGAFSNCISLERLKFYSLVELGGGYVNNLFNNCSALYELILPNGFKKIGSLNFVGCSSLVSITLPETIEEISGYAFSVNYSIKSVYILANSVPTLQVRKLSGDTSISAIYVKDELVNAYRTAPFWSEDRDIIFGLSEAPENQDDDSVHTLLKSSNKYAPTICFVPEGYTASEMSKFHSDAQEACDYMFNVEPFSTYKHLFDVYMIDAISNESGADIYSGSTKTKDKDTYFGLGWDNKDYGNMHADGELIKSFIAAHCPGFGRTLSFPGVSVIMLINDDRYAGLTSATSDGWGYSMVPVKSGQLTWAGNKGKNGVNATRKEVTCLGSWHNIVLHEGGGHCFGRLADEYWSDYYYTNNPSDLNEHNWTVPYAMNVTVDKVNKLYWEHMIPQTQGARETGKFLYTGTYEGGNARIFQGLWRSEQISCMDDNRPYFSAWQRWLIAKRAHSLAKMDYTYEQFIQDDPQYREIQRNTPNAGEEGRISTRYNNLTPQYGALNLSIISSSIISDGNYDVYPQLPSPILID